MSYILKSITVKNHPVLHLQFTDGFAGDLDLAETIARGSMFTPLNDPQFFAKVQMASDGYSFGWLLDDLSNELDFSAEGARIDLESLLVKKTAHAYRARIEAAE